MAGGAVAASHYEAPRLSLYTSLRVNDLTLEGISTFYAELKRIKNIIDGIKRGEKIFALIDEIFKGTNASDRLVGATRVIEKLLNQYAIISTHDFELCKIQNVLNYHFNEDYDNDKIKFDYKLVLDTLFNKNVIKYHSNLPIIIKNHLMRYIIMDKIAILIP